MGATNFQDLVFTVRILACMDMIKPIGQGWVFDNFSLQKLKKNPISKIKTYENMDSLGKLSFY
jgi:hypothetical protein